ncbi:MAG: flagellar motor switch protein FliG [Treponema sp.]|nr:flagellar motor switch protein FliG [Treponema sp.]
MNMNDRLKNAYAASGKDVKKPLFEKVNRQVADILSASKPAQAPKENVEPAFIKTTETVPAKNAAIVHNAVKEAASVFTSHGLVKVPEQPREADGRENVYRRVAKFLLLIGENEAAKILPHLTDAQIERIIPEIASIRNVDKDEAEVILAEFQSLMQKTREDGGVDTARTILEKAFGRERAETMLSKAVPFKGGKPFDYLAEADSDRVLQLLKDEGGAVRSLVLSYLNPKVSAAVIQALAPDEKKDVIMRLAHLKELSPEVVRRVDEAMKEKMDSLATEKSDQIDGRSALAQILKRMPLGAEEEILGNLSAQDPDLGADLRNRLFTEEDIINADDRFVAETLHGMDNVGIAFLIAGKDEDFRRKILRNVSQNRAAMILDEEAARRPLLRSDCEKITSLFFATLRRAWEDGSLIIKGRDDDIYV